MSGDTGAVNAVAQAVNTDRLRASLEWFAAVRRDTGGPGEASAATYVAGEMRDAGIPVTVHELPACARGATTYVARHSRRRPGQCGGCSR